MDNTPSDTNARRPGEKTGGGGSKAKQQINAVGLIPEAKTLFFYIVIVNQHDWEGMWDIPSQQYNILVVYWSKHYCLRITCRSLVNSAPSNIQSTLVKWMNMFFTNALWPGCKPLSTIHTHTHTHTHTYIYIYIYIKCGYVCVYVFRKLTPFLIYFIENDGQEFSV